MNVSCILALLTLGSSVYSWAPTATTRRPASMALLAKKDEPKTTSRHDFLAGLGAALMGSTCMLVPHTANAKGGMNLGDPKSVVGREIQSFNGLIYNFKNTRLDGGLDASTIDEPSVPFIEFGEKMKNGEVAFVEFIAPYGDVAYATFKSKDGKKTEKPIRIGQGYPTRSNKSWSSPDYVIRSVSNFGVPYKFTVPALEKFKVKK